MKIELAAMLLARSFDRAERVFDGWRPALAE